MRNVQAPTSPPTGPALALAPYFSCTSHTSGRAAVWVQAIGELDIAGAPYLERMLDQAQIRSRLVVLDLEDLTFIDIAGLHVIVAASTYARLAGQRLIVLRLPEQVTQLLELTGTANAIESHLPGLRVAIS